MKQKTVVDGKMSKKIFCLIVPVLLVLSSFASGAQGLASSHSNWIAKESYGPLEVIANITLDKEPKCIAVNDETNRVYVGVEGGLVVIDGETDEVLTEILSDTEVVALAVNPQTNRVYAAVYGENVTVINGATNQVVGGILERVYNSYELAVNPVTNLVYIADWTTILGEYDRVRVYHGENLTLIETVNIPGSNESTTIQRVGVAVNPDTNRIYATWRGNNTLHVIDGNTHEITKTVEPSSFSDTVTVNQYTDYVYVGKAVLDGETLVEVTSDYQGDLKAVNPLSNILYTTQYENLYALNGSTHAVLDSLELHWWISSYFDPIAVNPQTSKIYMINYQANQVSVVIPEFPVWTAILLILIVLTVAITIYKRRLLKTPIH